MIADHISGLTCFISLRNHQPAHWSTCIYRPCMHTKTLLHTATSFTFWVHVSYTPLSLNKFPMASYSHEYLGGASREDAALCPRIRKVWGLEFSCLNIRFSNVALWSVCARSLTFLLIVSSTHVACFAGFPWLSILGFVLLLFGVSSRPNETKKNKQGTLIENSAIQALPACESRTTPKNLDNGMLRRDIKNKNASKQC